MGQDLGVSGAALEGFSPHKSMGQRVSMGQDLGVYGAARGGLSPHKSMGQDLGSLWGCWGSLWGSAWGFPPPFPPPIPPILTPPPYSPNLTSISGPSPAPSAHTQPPQAPALSDLFSRPRFRPKPRPFLSRPPMLPSPGAAPPWPRLLLLWARRCAVRAALCGAGAALLLWVAAFAYGGFYFLTVPAAGLVAPVHFRFR